MAYTFEKQHQIVRGLVNQTALATALADPNPSTAFNPFADASSNNPATLAAIGGSGVFDSVSSLRTVSLTARGPTLSLPGGDIEASIGTDYRIQSIETQTTYPGLSADNTGRLRRSIAAAFGELRVPLIGESNALGFARRLELSVGARHERYSDIGNASASTHSGTSLTLVPEVFRYYRVSGRC